MSMMDGLFFLLPLVSEGRDTANMLLVVTG